jgi:hypothetical protein
MTSFENNLYKLFALLVMSSWIFGSVGKPESLKLFANYIELDIVELFNKLFDDGF